jgi:hypothetical protein
MVVGLRKKEMLPRDGNKIRKKKGHGKTRKKGGRWQNKERGGQ